MGAKTLRIEIYQSPWKKGAWCIRIGDIAGSTEHSNVPKEDILKEIEDEMNEIGDLSKQEVVKNENRK